jgi:hypothetical protein
MRNYKAEARFTKRGCTVGFTTAGEPVWGNYHPKTKCWRVQVGERPSLVDQRNQSFATERDAAGYACTLMNETKTAELAWW